MSKKNDLDSSFNKALAAVRGNKKGTHGMVHRDTSAVNKEDIALLKSMFPKGSTAFLILRKKSSSNLPRVVGVVAFKRDGKNLLDFHPNYRVAKILGMKEDRQNEGIKVGGGGMDVGLHLISSLSRKLYGDDSAIKHRWL